MPKLTTKDGDIDVSVARVVRMADRMQRFASAPRRENYRAKAKRRLAAGPCRKVDTAIVIAGGG